MFVVGAMCSPVYCLPPPILLTNHCFSCSTCGIWVLAFISPVNPWQNGSANMRTQQRKRKRKTPATISSPLYQCILQFEALSSCRQQGNDVRKFAKEFSGVAEGLGYMKRPSRMSSTVPLMNPWGTGSWHSKTGSSQGGGARSRVRSRARSVSPQSPLLSPLRPGSPQSPLQSPLRSVSLQSPLQSPLRSVSPDSPPRPGSSQSPLQSPLRSGSRRSPLRSPLHNLTLI